MRPVYTFSSALVFHPGQGSVVHHIRHSHQREPPSRNATLLWYYIVLFFVVVPFFIFFSFFSTKLFSYCYQGFLYLFLYLSYLLISFTTSGLFFNKYKALRHKSFIFSIILILFSLQVQGSPAQLFHLSRYKAPQHTFFIFRYKAPQHNFFFIFVLTTTIMST